MLLATRGWIIGDDQARPPYSEFGIGRFWLQLDMNGHLQIRTEASGRMRGGAVYEQQGHEGEGLLYHPELGEQCLKLMRAMMILEELADV